MIVFNALQMSMSGGIGRYSYELAKELYKENIELKIVIRDIDRNKFEFVKEEDLIIVKGIKNSIDRNWYEQWTLPKEIYRKYPAAIIHYPDSMAPIFAKNKVVITIHDIAFKSLKNVFKLKTKLWKNFITKISIKKANRIIAITEFTQKEILKNYEIATSKINVVYNGFNDFSEEEVNRNEVRKEILEIDKKYILTVSTISPRKNIDGIIKAFYKIKDEIEYKLIIAGANGWMYENIYKLVEELKISDRVIFLGKVNDEELKYLYKNTKLFVYASFYEGFGLPPLEAMSYGKVCLVSNTTSMPEVVGSGAIMINPYDVEDISKNMKSVILEEKNMEKILELSKERIKKFSWKKCAENTKKVYLNLKK